MNKYIGTKLIEAEPAEKDGKEGYKVRYKDGYESWSPKNIFESAYLTLVDNPVEPEPELSADEALDIIMGVAE